MTLSKSSWMSCYFTLHEHIRVDWRQRTADGFVWKCVRVFGTDMVRNLAELRLSEYTVAECASDCRFGAPNEKVVRIEQRGNKKIFALGDYFFGAPLRVDNMLVGRKMFIQIGIVHIMKNVITSSAIDDQLGR